MGGMNKRAFLKWGLILLLLGLVAILPGEWMKQHGGTIFLPFIIIGIVLLAVGALAFALSILIEPERMHNDWGKLKK
jgi:hypothetical protein